jgi:ABC-type polar amino acid transport system ATPase subunit
MVRVRGLSKRFGDTVVLRELSVDVAAGEVLVVVGPSGGGKSTLLRCLGGIETADAGEMVVKGKPLARVRRGLVGMVFQQFNLFPHLTALGNITLAPRVVNRLAKQDAEQRAHALLARVGIPEKAGAYPAELSGGQQQRLAIARSLAMDPELMLFDEATSALDREIGMEVMRTMRQLADDGMTMIVVTHELWFAENVADRVIFLEGGEIIEDAPPRDFFGNPKSERARRFLREILPEAEPRGAA